MCVESFADAIGWLLLFVAIAVMVGIPCGYFTMKGLYNNDKRRGE